MTWITQPDKVGNTMRMTLRTSAEAKVLFVASTGEFSLEEAKRIFLEVLDAAARHQSAKVLLDGRGIVGELSNIQRFFYGEFVAQAIGRFREHSGFRAAPQFAYVLAEPVLDPLRFGETVAVNRGVYVKTFDNLDNALGWLGLEPTNKPDAGAAAPRT
jgi:hypothetical protein